MQDTCGPLLQQLAERGSLEGGTEGAQPSRTGHGDRLTNTMGSHTENKNTSPGTQCASTKVLSIDHKAQQLLPSWQDLDVWESVNKDLSPL